MTSYSDILRQDLKDKRVPRDEKFQRVLQRPVPGLAQARKEAKDAREAADAAKTRLAKATAPQQLQLPAHARRAAAS